MLSTRDLHLVYGARTVLDVPAFALPPGTTTALVGPNGSGKSTLLRILAGVEPPTAGQVALEGRPARTAADRRAHRRRVTLVEQHPILFDMTVRQNLRDALRLAGRPARGDDAIGAALEALDVAHLADRRGRALSAGETQRVAIARSILLEPDVLLLDEPLSAADRNARVALGTLLARLHDRGTTICLSSHLLEEAYHWSSRIFTLVEGRLEAVTPENMFPVVLPAGTGSKTVRAGPLTLAVVTDREGPAMAVLPPDELLVSRAPLTSSARNHFAGRVTAVAEDGRGRIRLVVDAGVELVARITPESLRELEIAIGNPVVLTIKAMAVRVF